MFPADLGKKAQFFFCVQAAASPPSHRWHVDLRRPGFHRLPGSGKISQWEPDHSWSYPQAAGRKHRWKTGKSIRDFGYLTTLWVCAWTFQVFSCFSWNTAAFNPKVGRNLLPTKDDWWKISSWVVDQRQLAESLPKAAGVMRELARKWMA